MFSIERESKNGFDKVILKDRATQTFVEIIPACGAIMNSFNVIQDNENLNVIQSYQSVDEFRGKLEEQGFLGCKLSPFVCRINKGIYRFGENKYQIQKYYSGKNALHGLLYDQPFVVIKEDANEQRAMVRMMFQYRALDSGYPFNYDCIVTYELEKDNKVNVITEAINRDKGLIPIQDGWHPYFTLGAKIDDLQLEFQSKEMVVFDDELIPTGELIRYEEFCSLKKMGSTVFDNCFTLNFAECQPMCVLRNSSKKVEIEIHPEMSYPYLQLYTPSHRNSIAIENLSSAPDAFNNDMGERILEPGESAIFKTSYKITLLA